MQREPDLQPLLDWLAMPSVSADPGHAQDVEAAGEWVCNRMRDVPGARLELRRLPGARHPCVVGRIEATHDAPRTPTVAVYGHFDVQPAGDPAEWSSAPFAPEVRDGWLYARGAADSKANCFIVLEAISRLATDRSLPVNIDLLFDGEEEIDGIAIPDHAARLPAPDAAFICDGGLCDDTTPCFWVSARGTLYYRLSLRAAERELHSGSFGGAALNAAHALIGCLHEATWAGVGNGGRARALASIEDPQDGAETLERAGARPADPTAAEQFHQRTVLMSAVDVNSICAGEVGLQKTAIPPHASADVSIRVGPGEDPARLDVDFRARLEEHAPLGAELSIERLVMVPPGETPSDSHPLLLASAAFERVFRARPRMVGTGGTLPLFSTYAERGVPVIASGFASPDGAVHAADECFPLRNLPLGLEATCELLRALAGLTPS